ncbi:MAG: T9SS type A sorting domain-containing protein [Ignavibacteriales bacterium]|nr:T9SS type A sorting domain-containing protein [Ignavibacteriales bacterium]
MKLITSLLTLILLLPLFAYAQNYAGSQYCQTCHSNSAIGGTQYTIWEKSLHSKIHLVATDSSIRPLNSFVSGEQISMGSSYNNAKVILSKNGTDFFAQIGVGGTTYKITYTYGYGWKQRYLVKIDTSYYMLPIQYNLVKYLDNSSGSWASYNTGNWFNSDGTPKPINNTFRSKSWDKNCMGCHVTGYTVEKVVQNNDTSWVGKWANNSSGLNMTVGCEACHGPSQSHSGGPSGTVNPNNLPTKEMKLEVCGQCHNRSSSWRGAGLVGTHEYPKDEINNRYFKPGDTLAHFLNLATPGNQTGGPGTWPDLKSARQHHQQYQEMLGSKHYDNAFVEITCFTCHVSHKETPNKHQIVDTMRVSSDVFAVKNEDNTLCLSCHATHGPFATIPKAWVKNPTVYHDSIGAVVNQHSKHNLYDPLNTMTSGGLGRCSNCHMTRTATTARSYDIATHTFSLVSPYNTIQYAGVTTPTQGMLNTCASACHRNPSGSTAAAPSFGIYDSTLTKWNEASDLALADTLWRYYQTWVSVKEITHAVPVSFSLSQNYPNPFNPSTRITIEIPKQSSARLVIYNVNGEKIATVMDDVYNKGRYEVTWSGKDDFGFPVSSGIYFYKLEAGTFTMAKKMLLLK